MRQVSDFEVSAVSGGIINNEDPTYNPYDDEVTWLQANLRDLGILAAGGTATVTISSDGSSTVTSGNGVTVTTTPSDSGPLATALRTFTSIFFPGGGISDSSSSTASWGIRG